MEQLAQESATLDAEAQKQAENVNIACLPEAIDADDVKAEMVMVPCTPVAAVPDNLKGTDSMAQVLQSRIPAEVQADGKSETGECFYAVRGGEQPGIYASWKEASAHCQRGGGALCKKFLDKPSAVAFIEA